MNKQANFPLTNLLSMNKENYITSMDRVYKHYDVFLDDDIEQPSQYRELLSALFNAGEDDSMTIFINSNGGHLDTALSIVEGLKSTNAHVTAVINGACHSAASIISMYCHEVAVLDSAYSMIHTASFGASGNTSNVKSHTEFTVSQVEKLLNETYEGFLSKDELAKVKQGVELWFSSEEIRERMGHRVKFLTSKLKKQIKKDSANANSTT